MNVRWRATGTTDTVNIVFTIVWQIVVKDVRYGGIVPARRDIGRWEYPDRRELYPESAGAFSARHRRSADQHDGLICRQCPLVISSQRCLVLRK